MTLTLPKARTAGNAILAMLQAFETPTFSVYDADVPNEPPADSTGIVHPYAVMWAGPGQPIGERLCRTPDARELTWQVTAVGGTRVRAMAAVDIVMDALVGVRLVLPDGTATKIRADLDPGPVQKDTTVNPARYFSPLLFRCRLS